MSTKNTKPKILTVVRSDAFIEIRHEVAKTSEQKTVPDKDKPGEPKTKLVTSSSEFREKAHEAPLPAFDAALQALADVIVNILGVGQAWKKGISVVSLHLTYTESNVRTAVIGFVKQIDATSGLHPMKTPAFQIDDGKKSDDGRRQCAKKHADAVIEFIKEAQRYAAGERSQQLLKFEDDGAEEEGEDDKTIPMPGVASEA